MPYTLLLADDSVTIQRVIELTFADEDVTVIAVSDGDQAIERLEASPPDIVLADIGMPGKNGYEVAQYIRKSPRLAHIPVVLLTGAFEPVDQARANAAGCDGVLAKPFEPQLVIGRVKELLARGRGAADRPAPASESHLERMDADDFSLPPLEPLAPPHSDSIWAAPLAGPAPVTPVTEPPLRGAADVPVPRAELNDYFDRLDAAFSTLSSSAPAQKSSPAEAIADPAAPAISTDIDWFGTATTAAPRAEPWDAPATPATDAPMDVPLSFASPQPPIGAAPIDFDAIATPDERLAPIEESAPVAPVEPPAAPAAPVFELPLQNPPPLPTLPDAFAALLAAEQSGASSALAGTWPASPAAAVSDEMIEQVTRRVLDRLSDTVVREAVADITSKVAERLVREEIARIKASLP